jgi:hypothetical protein
VLVLVIGILEEIEQEKAGHQGTDEKDDGIADGHDRLPPVGDSGKLKVDS